MVHIEGHIFNGVCICPCKSCTAHKAEMIQCICPDCPKETCGLKVARMIR